VNNSLTIKKGKETGRVKEERENEDKRREDKTDNLYARIFALRRLNVMKKK
jgi:hypothetical protein